MSGERSTGIEIEDLGRLGYGPALACQRARHAGVLSGEQGEAVLMVEHEPVVTIGRQPDARRHLLAGEAMLGREGVALHETDRGGDVTYHGPGQVVAYPIVRLNDRKLNLRQYVRLLEEAVIETLGEFGIEADRDPSAVGVWVEGRGGEAAKIAAIGVRAARWVTMHGLALNVRPNLEHFKLIVPCGLAGRPVTSMAELLGAGCPSLGEVAEVVGRRVVGAIEGATAGARSG